MMIRNSLSSNRRRDDLDEYWFEKVAVESKTAEEIHEHTISEDLSPVEKTLAMLNSRLDIQRLAGIRSLSSVIITDRDETIRRVLPKFKSIIEQSVDSDEHAVAAEAVYIIVQRESFSYSEFMSTFSNMICNFIFPPTTTRFTIDFGPIWCQALCDIIDAFPNTVLLTSLLDLIFNRSLHGSYVRDRLAIILAKLSNRLNSQIVESRLLPVFKNFINDTNADIRALACQKLPVLAASLELDRVSNLIMPLCFILAKDENLIVRQTCFESLLVVSDYVEEPKMIEQIGQIIISLVKFGLSSRTVHFISIIASRLGDLCHALNVLNVEEYKFIRETFLRLIQEKVHDKPKRNINESGIIVNLFGFSFKNVPDCRLVCASHFSTVMNYLGHDQITNELETLFCHLCTDNDPKIRSIMVTTIVNVIKSKIMFAKFYQNDEKYLLIIWNEFLLLLNDSNLDVILAIAANLLKIFMQFSRNTNEGNANGSICSEPAVNDSETFINNLLEYERRLFDTTLSWRSHILCLQAFVHLPYLLSSEQMNTKILPRMFTRIFSAQVCVREVAVDSYIQVLRKIPRRSTRKNAFQKLKTDLLLNNSYKWRIMYIRICRQILIHYSKRFFKENILETILSIEYDPVLNVRIQLIPLLIEIKSILRLPADRVSISKIESMMERFLVDKTITLHDLANNGLLQLDQIRSYNPLSLPTNNSTDDAQDQSKENEENLLDEIDASLRRSSNKSNEQHIIVKRIKDVSLSTKPTSLLQTARGSKTSNDIYRKPSLPSDATFNIKVNKISVTKQRRGQTFTDSTAVSRVSNSTSKNEG